MHEARLMAYLYRLKNLGVPESEFAEERFCNLIQAIGGTTYQEMDRKSETPRQPLEAGCLKMIFYLKVGVECLEYGLFDLRSSFSCSKNLALSVVCNVNAV